MDSEARGKWGRLIQMVVLTAILPASCHAVAATGAAPAPLSNHVQAGFDSSARFAREFERVAYWLDVHRTSCRQDVDKEHDPTAPEVEQHPTEQAV